MSKNIVPLFIHTKNEKIEKGGGFLLTLNKNKEYK